MKKTRRLYYLHSRVKRQGLTMNSRKKTVFIATGSEINKKLSFYLNELRSNGYTVQTTIPIS